MGGSGPVCGVMFVAGSNAAILVTGRWINGTVSTWSTSVGPGGELAKRLSPVQVEQVVFGKDGTLRFDTRTLPPLPTAAACVRDWNRRPSAPRMAISRQHPRGVHVTMGVMTTVRDGVLRVSSQPACRLVFALRGDSFLLVFGVWGKEDRVTAWKPPRTSGATAGEIVAMTQGGLSNATVRADGTLHLFR
jgi:hypothetical protein